MSDRRFYVVQELEMTDLDPDFGWVGWFLVSAVVVGWSAFGWCARRVVLEVQDYRRTVRA